MKSTRFLRFTEPYFPLETLHTLNHLLALSVATNSSYTDIRRGPNGTGSISTTEFTYLQYRCVSCPFNTYNIGRGQLNFTSLEDQLILANEKCHECPPGAVCDGEIKAIDNYYGYRISATNQLKFLLCPSGFCCASDTTPCSTYNTCHAGRAGLLCGSCEENYKLSFLSEECIPKEGSCDVKVFTAYFVVYSLLYTLVFIAIVSAADIVAMVKVWKSDFLRL